MPQTDLLWKIALGLIPGVGDIGARKLVSCTGSPEAVFREPYGALIKIRGIGDATARAIADRSYLRQAEKEAEYVTAKGIKTYFYLDDDYPRRLKECTDSPVIIYYSGSANPDADKVLSIVGTRKATPRGREICESIIHKLSEMFPGLLIVSGLAYGVDITAHKAALGAGLSTIAVLAHGLKTIYPPEHSPVARKMLTQGGLLTDFVSDAPAERNNFLKRNRIIAGISGALLVIESGVKGGALVTAEMALSYSRDVMAVPGRPSDNWSGGCNRLIKRNIAALVENASDICEFLNWQTSTEIRPKQQELFHDLDATEAIILKLIDDNDLMSADQIARHTGIPVHTLLSLLLSLEVKGRIRTRPGNNYSLPG
ncbi:MAG: DNA-protecting protein DprA [Bacteroidetes bacterium]|nr:DNA-protecting protein DprA [Bacteroidota bacterium]